MTPQTAHAETVIKQRDTYYSNAQYYKKTECLIAEVAKTDDWPVSKDMLIKKHYKAFAKFTKNMDKILKINT